MKIKQLLLRGLVALTVLFSGATARAQVSDYTFAQSSGTYTPVTGGTILATTSAATGAIPSLDSYLDSITIPFSFVFNGAPYTKTYVNSNGFVTFGGAPTASLSAPISSTLTTFTGVIAAFARDLNGVYNMGSPAVSSDMRYETVGTAPNRQLIIQWTNFRPAYNSSTTSAYVFDFQIILEETTNKIHVKYGGLMGYLIGSASYSGTAQIGLRGAAATDFNNRLNPTTVNFTASTAGTASNSTQAFNTTATPPGMPTSGLTYTWTPGTCPGPSAITLSGVSTSGVTINWTAAVPAPASGYQYEVRTSGAAGSGSTGLAASGNTLAGATSAGITGLSTATAYSVYVRSNCGGGDYSGWSAANSFTTLCDAFPAPFAEGFNSGALPACWTNSNSISSTTANLLWKFSGAPGYGTTSNGRPTGTYAWLDASSPYNAVVSLTSPLINLSTLTAPFLKFDWFKDNEDATTGYTNNNLMVEGYNGTTWVTLFNDTSNSATWRTVGIPLPAAFVGLTNAQFRFSVDKSLSNNFYDDILLDSVSVADVPTCFAPTAITATGVTSAAATLNWTAPTSAPSGGYQYEVRTSGAAGSGATGLAASGNTIAGMTTANVSGLNPATTYYIYVRGNCGSGGYSVWATGTAFTTSCVPVTTYPFTEGFPATGLPPCWTAGNSGTSTYNWTGTASDASYGVSAPQAGPGFAFLYVYLASTSSNPYTLTSPSFTLSGAAKQVQYYYYLGANGYKGTTGAAGTDPYPLQLLVSNNGGTTWDTLYQHSTANSVFASSSSTSFWTLNTVNLSAYTGQTVVFRFVSNSNYGSGTVDQGLDEFSILNLPSCVMPSGVSASSVSTSGATLNWTAAIPAPGSGYQYEVRSSGAAGSGATGLAASGNTVAGATTANATGLSAATTYTVYVRSNCGSGEYSTWTAGYTFTTLCLPVSVPYLQNFDAVTVPAIPGCSAVQDVNADANTWKTVGSNANSAPNALMYAYNSNAANDWWFTPGLNMTAGTAYNITFAYRVYSSSYPEKMEVKVGNAQNAGAMTGTALWSNTNIVNTSYLTTTISYTPTTTGVFYFGWHAFSDADQWNLYVDDIAIELGPTCVNPTVMLGNDTTICAGSSVTLNAGNPGASYLWSTGAISQTINVTTSGSYSVAVTVPGGCVGRDTIAITVNPLPVVNLGNDTAICAGSSLTLNAGNPGATYMWSNGATSQTTTVTTAGAYSVLVTNGGCSKSDTINVSLTALPVVNIGNDTTICAGSSVSLNAGNPGASYLWSTGATSQTISATTSGSYSVSVTNSGGCKAADTVAVTVNPLPVVNLGADTTFCSGDMLTLDAGNPGASYVWSNGSTAQTTIVNMAGTYFVSVTNAGCTATDTITVMTTPSPVVDLGMDTTICSGTPLTLDAGNPGAAYAWSNGDTTQTISVSAAGTYSVMVTSGACAAMDTILIDEAVAPVAATIVVVDNMPEFEFSAPGTTGAATYAWDFGDGTTAATETATHTYLANGVFTVTLVVTNECGQTGSVTTTVNVSGVGVNTVTGKVSNVQVYPNPSNGLTVVEAKGATIQTIEVVDNLGRVILRTQPNAAKTVIDVKGMAQGIYTLRIQTSQGNSTMKLVVKD